MDILDFPSKNNGGTSRQDAIPAKTSEAPAPTPEDLRRVSIARKVVTELFGPKMFQNMRELQAVTISALQKECTQMTVDPRMIQAIIQMNGALALELGNRILKEIEDGKRNIQTRPQIIVP